MNPRLSAKFAFLGLVVLLAGCAATAPQYYSLQAPAMSALSQSGEIASDYVISVQPVLIPEQLARPQILVSASSGSEVVPLNAALWAGPLESQIRDALADSLARRLNVLDVGLSKIVELPTWRIYVDIQRFDSVYGESVRHDVVWRLVPQNMPEDMGKRVCSAQVEQPVDIGMSALVEGHRRSLDMLAGVMAQSLPLNSSAASVLSETQQAGLHFRGCVVQEAGQV